MKQVSLASYRKAGQTRVDVGRFTFTVQRPTPAEVVVGRQGRHIDLAFTAAHIVGWENVLESDLLPGGDPEPAAFAADVFAAWMEDMPDLWAPLAQALSDSYRAYEEALEARGKP